MRRLRTQDRQLSTTPRSPLTSTSSPVWRRVGGGVASVARACGAIAAQAEKADPELGVAGGSRESLRAGRLRGRLGDDADPRAEMDTTCLFRCERTSCQRLAFHASLRDVLARRAT